MFRFSLIAFCLLCPLALQANLPPDAPIITEPEFDGQIVNPADVHLESGPFSDPDSGPDGTFRHSDYEIWTISPAERVWASLDTSGVESFHNHLGDGVFENSHAGRVDLLFSTDYRLRIRHRDNSGDAMTEYSPWTERFFTTGDASTIFPILLLDVIDSPAPEWKDANNNEVILPAGTTPPKLSLVTEDDDFELLVFEGDDGLTHTVRNPAGGDHDHAFKMVIESGSASLVLPETTLAFSDNLAVRHTIYLPPLSLGPGETRLLWVSRNGSSYWGTLAQPTPDFTNLARGSDVPWFARQPGFKVEVVASGFRNPANIAFLPNPGPHPEDPLYYVTELYGNIKVVRRNGVVSDFASNLLNYTPSGNFPGSGEQGLGGIVVDPATGDVYLGLLHHDPAVGSSPRVVRLTSSDGGLTAATQAVVLDMAPETQGQSHYISNFSIGPDGKLYVHNGDGFDASTARDLDQFRGKILRMNLDGSAPGDNPFFNATDGVSARDYVWAYGLRNPWGGAWRASDGQHYEVENGPATDRFAKVTAGQNLGWTGLNSQMAIGALHVWAPSTAPTNLTFIEAGVFAGSGFPASKQDRAFVALSGPTFGLGPQGRGKRIEEFHIDATGSLVDGPHTLVEYTGSGRATVCGIAAGPDGLYFTDLYKDTDTTGPTDPGANVLRVSYVGYAAITADVQSGDLPLTVQFTDASEVPQASGWLWDFGDGNSSTEQHPQHVYQAAGLHTVTLSITGSNGVVTTRRHAFIAAGVAPPSSNFTFFRFTPTALRDDATAIGIQLSEFRLLSAGSPILPGSNVTVSNPGGSSPTGEEVAKVHDEDVNTKWLDLNKGSLLFEFPNAVSVDSYAFTTANDAPERDPVGWILEGSDDEVNWTLLDSQSGFPTPTARFADVGPLAAVDDSPPSIVAFTADQTVVEPGGQVTLSWDVAGADLVEITPGLGPVAASGSTLVAPGATTTYTISATNPFGSDSADVEVEVATRTEASYRFFRFTPTSLRDDLSSVGVQLAEFDLFHDGLPVGGATATNPGGSSPFLEGPPNAVDDNPNTKWLDFNKGALVLDFGTTVTVDGHGLTTANDTPDRDPVSWILEGSLDGASWVLLDTVSGFPTPTDRFAATGDLPLLDLASGPLALLVVAEATNPNVSELAMKTQLEQMAGFTVLFVSDSDLTPTLANGKDLIVISSTVTPTVVGTTFTNLPVPVLCCDHELFDDLGMTLDLVSSHGIEPAQTRITILDPNHPLARSHTGTLDVYNAPNGIVWGSPPTGAEAIRIASLEGDPSRLAHFGYLAGSTMATGTAPGRRVGYFFGDTGGETAFHHGWHLFVHSAQWLINSPPSVTLEAPVGGSSFEPGESILLRANAVDSDLTGIDFYADATYLGSVSAPPYELTWTDAPGGTHSLTAVATDELGETDTSPVVAVTVSGPFDNFRAAYFTAPQLADPLVSGPAADFDGDGFSTLLEHFFGMDPTRSDQPATLAATRINDAGTEYGQFAFRYKLSATDVHFEPGASLDLVSWESGGDRLVPIGFTDHGDGTRTVTYRSLFPDVVREFFRVTVDFQ